MITTYKGVRPLAFFSFIIALITTFPARIAHAQEAEAETISPLYTLAKQLSSIAKGLLDGIVQYMEKLLFLPIPVPFTEATIPFLILWLAFGAVFFTCTMRFPNLRLFGHALAVVRGKYSKGDEPGEVTHAQALFAAVSATVGIGNIGGVAVAVAKGGPGAVIWMMLAGVFGMTAKFTEVTAGQMYRKIDANGKVSGGAFHYLEDGLAEMKLKHLGKVLAVIFAIFCIGGSLGGGNMFQANQSVIMVTSLFEMKGLSIILSAALALLVAIVLMGGIKRIAHVAEKIVPFMAITYILAGIVILVVNSDLIPGAVLHMISAAFTGDALVGGAIGAMIVGVQRAAFSNEAGLGSAPIAHSAAKTSEPVREGVVALLEPFLDTVVICFLTGLIITVTGVYEDPEYADKGIQMTSAAYASVISWFPSLLALIAALFAFSTMISWSYYGERSWHYLFGEKHIWLFYLIFASFTFIGGIAPLDAVINFSDMMLLSMALPNLLGLYFLSPKILRTLKQYEKKLRDKEFPTYP